jgi:Type II secretion system (T2SS), protein E, N-terminal domain
VSAELARRLIHSGALPAQVEAALLDAVNRSVSLTQAVNELYPELVELLERALDRSDFPAIHIVRPLSDLVRSLPVGMCERLLSLPVHRDARSERVDIASVDALDGHVASEFAFHLGVPVRVLRAPFPEIVAALEGLHAAGIFLPGLSKIVAARSSHPAKAVESHTTAPPEQRSEPALPLVRKSLAPSAAWVAEAPAFSIIEPPPMEPDEPLNEPVLSLGRPKPFAPAEHEPAGPPWTLEFEAAVEALDAADTPERVVSSLCEGLGPVRALVFAVKSASFDVRGGSAGMGSPAELRAISVPAASGSMLDTATKVGFYLGPFVPIAALASLESKWFAAPGSDCYARAVNVSERPSLVVLMAGFSESTEATRRADVLSRTAGSTLERIVRMRKRS